MPPHHPPLAVPAAFGLELVYAILTAPRVPLRCDLGKGRRARLLPRGRRTWRLTVWDHGILVYEERFRGGPDAAYVVTAGVGVAGVPAAAVEGLAWGVA